MRPAALLEKFAMNGHIRRPNQASIEGSHMPYRDALLRRHKHGPIRPMEEPGLIGRLLGRR